jgi:hypothetical protein
VHGSYHTQIDGRRAISIARAGDLCVLGAGVA